MYKNAIILFLPVLIVLGCDSTQTSTTTEKTQTTKLETPQAPPISTTQKDNTAPAPEVTAAEVVTAPIKMAASSGEQVYKKFCANCHASGVAGAPKLGDTTAWNPRIAKGKQALYTSAKQGIPGTAMMAKGTCSTCQDEELEAAVDFMLSKSK